MVNGYYFNNNVNCLVDACFMHVIVYRCIASASTCNFFAAKLYCFETCTKFVIFYIQNT
jgi:hypothetical protein